ncbi:MAG: hypothetical protein IIZ39_14185, partial [Blautia sp.]|nr:hypothetical protein [Blautia sp.]
MEKLEMARAALHHKEGEKALTLLNEILEEDESCSDAWFLAMQCFQLLYPLEELKAEDELACARYAIRYAPKEKKRQRQLSVYQFLLDKVKGVLKRDALLLADGKELLSFYQRETYFDAAGAPRKTFEKDKPLLEAVMHTLDYCEELFAFIPGSQIK